MKSDIRLFYNQEFWYISAFLNSKEVNERHIANEIETLLKERLKNLKESEFPYLDNFPNAQEKKRTLIDMLKNISIECNWVPYFQGFSYIAEKKDFTHDNKPLIFDSLGYFKFNIEYYKNDTSNQNNKDVIEPILIQQIPIKAREIIEEYCKKIESEYLLMDCESYIYDFVTSNKIKPTEIQWTTENIKKYKKILGYWIEIYSGSWEDYSEELFNQRIENNLSNRTSELHYLRRNSGFIYMKEENYKKYFDSYMIENVLESTAKVRAMQYALTSINESLDILFKKRHSMFMSLERIEEKIDQLRFLKGTVQTNLSLIYNEMDWNRRQHYTKVLTHLLNEFRLEEIVERLEKKFDLLHDSLEKLYSTKREQQDKVRERLLTFLSILFGLGIIADITSLIMNAFALELGHPFTFYLNIIMLVVIILCFFSYLIYYIDKSRKLKVLLEKGYAVDAVIEDGKGNVILIKRKYPPFQGKYALPGGFIEKNETPEQAVIREVKEETNLQIKIKKKIGKYDKEGRDPRGKIVSTAFKCSIIGDLSGLKFGDDASNVELVPIKKLFDLDLAFDHKDILQDADVLK